MSINLYKGINKLFIEQLDPSKQGSYQIIYKAIIDYQDIK